MKSRSIKMSAQRNFRFYHPFDEANTTWTREREHKDDCVPEVSALDTSVSGLELDADTDALFNFDIPHTVIAPVTAVQERAPRRERRTVPGVARS